MNLISNVFTFAQPIDTARLLELLKYDMGTAGLRRLEALVIEPHRVAANATDVVPLIYLVKCCQELGGVPEGGRRFAVPAWAETPWPELTWRERLRIRWRRGSMDLRYLG